MECVMAEQVCSVSVQNASVRKPKQRAVYSSVPRSRHCVLVSSTSLLVVTTALDVQLLLSTPSSLELISLLAHTRQHGNCDYHHVVRSQTRLSLPPTRQRALTSPDILPPPPNHLARQHPDHCSSSRSLATRHQQARRRIQPVQLGVVVHQRHQRQGWRPLALPLAARARLHADLSSRERRWWCCRGGPRGHHQAHSRQGAGVGQGSASAAVSCCVLGVFGGAAHTVAVASAVTTPFRFFLSAFTPRTHPMCTH